MPNNIGLITKYSDEALDEIFAMESLTAILERNNDLLRFVSAHTVEIPDITMSGLGDYVKATGFPAGDVTLTWSPHALTKDRAKGFNIDNMDNEESAGIAFRELARQFMRTKVIPEVDAYRLSTLCALAAAGNKVAETIAANTIISKFNAAEKAFVDNEVPLNECVFFISTAVESLIKNTTEISKYILQTDYQAANGITYKLKSYDGIPIITVPPTRFKTSFTFGADGFAVTAAAYTLTEDTELDAKKTYYTKSGDVYSAVAEPAVESIGTYYELTTAPGKDINFMLVNFSAALPVKKHEKVRSFAPDTNQDADAWKFQYRLYHDIFTPKNKVNGIYVSHVA